MKNNQINASEIPHLVRLTADLFREMRESNKSPNNNPINLKEEKNKIHFVVDLLKSLVDTAYPLEENICKKETPSQEKSKDQEKAYKLVLELLILGQVPKCMLPTFEEWKRDITQGAK